MKKIDAESPFSKPKNKRMKSPQPLCHSDTAAQYNQYELEHKEISQAHRIASIFYRGGNHEVEFPHGTFRPPLIYVYQQAA